MDITSTIVCKQEDHLETPKPDVNDQSPDAETINPPQQSSQAILQCMCACHQCSCQCKDLDSQIIHVMVENNAQPKPKTRDMCVGTFLTI